jgi:protoporphyrinogen oxidase
MWARFKARTPRLGTFVGGFQAFADAFAARLGEMGVELRLNKPVEKVEGAEEGVRLRLEGGWQGVDVCLATVAPSRLARMVPDLPKGYREGLGKLKSMGAVVMVLALSQRLSEQGIYWHNLPKGAGFPFLALVEHTNFLSPEHFGGEHILYLGDYLEPEHEYFSLTKEELLERFLPALKRINPRFERSWVRKSWLFRTRYAQPVPGLHHSRLIPDLKTPLPGLWWASMSQVYPWDRGTNFAVELGRRAAARIIASQKSPQGEV